ncbi:hypothetical protein B484DRAFT_397462 [Ochromonadaceae sp. CCMP2298]|nr:hypothetical protein B484DRAFT_397462 [Ochromonadaceae sp. CCMP2298]
MRAAAVLAAEAGAVGETRYRNQPHKLEEFFGVGAEEWEEGMGGVGGMGGTEVPTGAAAPVQVERPRSIVRQKSLSGLATAAVSSAAAPTAPICVPVLELRKWLAAKGDVIARVYADAN